MPIVTTKIFKRNPLLSSLDPLGIPNEADGTISFIEFVPFTMGNYGIIFNESAQKILIDTLNSVIFNFIRKNGKKPVAIYLGKSERNTLRVMKPGIFNEIPEDWTVSFQGISIIPVELHEYISVE